MTRKDVKGDQPSGGETTWTNTGATRYGRGQHKTGSFGDDMLRPSPNHGTQRLPNDDDDDIIVYISFFLFGIPLGSPRITLSIRQVCDSNIAFSLANPFLVFIFNILGWILNLQCLNISCGYTCI